ncbi:MAG: permease [Bacillota bacterium]
MENLLELLPELLSKMIAAVITSLCHNWLPLSLAMLTAAIMKAYTDAEKLKQSLLKKPKVSILASVTVGAFTPLCACGTMAVIIGLLTTSLPWGPVMAFLTSSPLMSPDGFILLAGVIGFRFAIVMAVASIAIGLGSGFATHIIEKKTNFLKDQTRFSDKKPIQSCGCAGEAVNRAPVTAGIDQSCGCAGDNMMPVQNLQRTDVAAADAINCGCAGSEQVALQFQVCGCEGEDKADSKGLSKCVGGEKPRLTVPELLRRLKLKEVAAAFWKVGIRQILLFYSMFVAIGYLINYFIPQSAIMALFRPDSIFSVPLASLIGLPLYVTGESAIPLIQALLKGGAGEGSMMAFLITGAATSAWVIAGITTFMKRRAIILYVSYILAGAIIFGYLCDLLVLLGI